MSHSAVSESANIVLVGSFNPAIFQPAWFAAFDLIPSEDLKIAKGLKKHLSSHDITDFATEDFHLQVLRDRLSVSSTNAAFYESLKDLVVGTFNILRHTRVEKMGLNRLMHFKLDSEQEWHDVGHRLAPKQSWHQVLEKPGMASLTMEGKRPDEHKGMIRVRIESISKAKPYGVFVEVNDHYEVADPENLLGCSELMDVLSTSWSESLQRAEKIARAIIFQE